MELNFNELWIGDEVYVKTKGQNGRWEGPASGKRGRIRIGEKIFLIPLSSLEKARRTSKKEPELDLVSSPKPKTTAIQLTREIDLHIEILAPELKFQLPEMILNHQLKKCREFVEEAIRNKVPSIVIIHGKGTGVLKSEVEHYLQGISDVKFMIPKKDGGATEVWFTGMLF